MLTSNSKGSIFKDLPSFLSRLEHLNLQKPEIIFISGTDIKMGDLVNKYIQKKLRKEIRSYEYLVFSHEPGELSRLETELANIPLFSPYRFLLIRQGENILSNLQSDSEKYRNLKTLLKNIPEQVLLLILYSGDPPIYLTKLFDSTGFLHWQTRNLYTNQVEATLRKALQKHKLKLNQEAFFLLMEQISLEGKSGSIEYAVEHLQFIGKPNEELSKEQVSSVLFPSQGWNVFTLVDALFSGNLNAAVQQYKRFHSTTDNLFVLLKLMLKRMDEIRLAKLAYKQFNQEREILTFLSLMNRPQFIQNKILKRLQVEISNFNSYKQIQVYRFLINMQKYLKSKTPLNRQLLLFQQLSLRVFI